MIQPVGKGREGKISLFETDWDAVAKEAAAINEKYNGTPKEQRLTIAKQTSGNMYSTQNQHRIQFPFEDNVPQPEQKVAQTVQPNAPVKASYKFDPQNRLQNSKSILSSRTAVISDNGGPSAQMQTRTANSIWDDEVLTRLIAENDGQTQTERLRQAEAQQREDMRKSALNKLTEQLASVDQRKAAQVMPAGDQTVSEDQARFSKVSRNISIFDTLTGAEDFARLPEQTIGEKIAQNRREEREQVDESWRAGGRVKTSKQVVNSLFDALMRQSEEK